jgi:omega-6 fatty acid desaturase (delta-12 desaturase)
VEALMKATSQDKKWRQILEAYQTPDTKRSLWQIVNSIVPFLLLWYAMYRSISISYWLTLLFAIPTAGFMVRIFIIFHDCGHGSFFESRNANAVLGIVTGLLTFTPYYEWRHSHAIHHATAGNLDRRGTGDVLTITVAEYVAMPWWKRVGYRIMRNPLIMFTVGSFSVFAIGHRFPRKESSKRERSNVLWTNLALAGIIAGLMLLIGWQAFLLVQVPILFLGTSAGVWLFYVQHNFEDTYWDRKEHWDFLKVGLQGSSYYQLPGILQWFTGNIGFHHIHHLAPRVPNYKLPICHAENKLFHVQPLTIRTSLRSLRLRLWDEQARIMVGYEAVKRFRRSAPNAAS